MTTLNLQVSASSDDARENSGTVGLTGGSINIGGTNQRLGFRFTNVTIAQGLTVNQALVNFYVTSTTNDSPGGSTVGCQDSDDAGTFTTGTNNITNRTRTTALTTWSGNNIGSGYQAVDITAAVQEVINRPGWVSGNDIAVIIYGVTGADVTITTYDGNAALAATLAIDYAGPQTLTGAYISPTTTLYAGVISLSGLQTLTGAYISPTTALYAGMLQRGVWKIEGVSSGAHSAVNHIDFEIVTGNNSGRAILIFLLGSNVPNIMPISGVTTAGNVSTLFYAGNTEAAALLSTDVTAGTETVTLRLSSTNDAGYLAVALSGVDTARLAGANVAAEYANDTDVTEYYPTNSALIGLTYVLDSQTFTLAPDSGAYQLAGLTMGDMTYPYEAGALLIKPIEGGGSATNNIGATPTGTAPYFVEYTLALILPGTQGDLTGAYIEPTTTVYAGVITLAGQTLYGAYISPTTTVYAGSVKHIITGAYISPTTTLYAGTIATVAGPTQYIEGRFIGLGLPNVLEGAYIASTLAVYAGAITSTVELEGAYIESTMQIYAGELVQHASTATGAVWAGVIFNVT